MLSKQEKDRLYDIIVSVIGKDASIAAVKGGFNDKTVAVVERMFQASSECNENMKRLVVEIVGSSAFVAKGWLKKLLRYSKEGISKTTFKGYGCLVTVKSHWKSAIIISTYQ